MKQKENAMVSVSTKKKSLNSTQRRELCRIVTAQYDSTIACLRKQKALIVDPPEDPTPYHEDRNINDIYDIAKCDWLPGDVRAKARSIAKDLKSLYASVDRLRQPFVERHDRANEAVDAMCDQLVTDRNQRVADIWVASVEDGHEFLEGIPTPMDFRKALMANGVVPKLPSRCVPELPPCPTKHG